MPRARFLVALGLIALGALGVRAAFIYGVARHDTRIYDALYYELQAHTIAAGHGFTEPTAYLPGGDGVARPAADHPPVTALVLAGVTKLFGRHQIALRFTTALAGVGTVVLLGLLARDLAGARAGLIAAGLGAVYPFLWLNDGLLMSEAFAALEVTAALILTYRLRRRPSLPLAVALGAVCGLAALTRAELVLLAPGLVIALALSVRRSRPGDDPVAEDAQPPSEPAPRRRSRWGAIGAMVVGVSILVIAPWSLYNQARFDDPVLISTNEGLTLRGSNCDAAYAGPEIGLWVLQPGQCSPPPAPGADQSVASNEYRRQAFAYIRAHATRVPVVMAVRFGRTWNVFRPSDMLRVNEREGRPRWATTAGLVLYYPLVGFAGAGVVALHRRRVWLAPLLVPPVIVSLTALAFYGQTRLRLPAEPSLVVLAAVALAALSEGSWPVRARGDAVVPPHEGGHQPAGERA